MIALLLLVALAIVLVAIRSQSDKKQNPGQAEKPAETKSETWMGAFNAYDKAFNIIKKNPTFVIAAAALATVGYAVGVYLYGQPRTGEMSFPMESTFLLPVMLVTPIYSLCVVDGKNPNIRSLYQRPLRTFGILIVTAILMELIIAISAVAFLIPAIWTIGWFALAPFVVMDKNLGPIKSLKHSKQLAQDHIGKVWGLVGVSILLSIAISAVSFAPYSGKYLGAALGGAFTVWGSVASAVLYRWLQTQQKSVK